MVWPEKKMIRRGVATMLEKNLAIRHSEKVLVMTDPPFLNLWREIGLERLQEALERSVLARMVAELAAEPKLRSDIVFLPSLPIH